MGLRLRRGSILGVALGAESCKRTSENPVHANFAERCIETVRKGVRVALRLQIWCVYGARNRLKRAFGRPVGLRCRPLRDFSDSLYEYFIDGTSANRPSRKFG